MLAPAVMLLLVVQSGWADQCDSQDGPAGTVECVQLSPRYNDEYQWATCLTNAYIQQSSNHQHYCLDRTETYCWYQCMIEDHGKNSGSVTKDCSCTTSDPTSNPNTSLSPTTPLPPECYSPPGDSCDWYRNCLERKYPCEATSSAYALKYAEHFCRLYDTRFALFSPIGQKWVNAVRKCLQVSLVSQLRPWKNPTCEEIQQKALASHTPCYLHPDKDAPSICDVDCSDYYKIFWTIKGAFIKSHTASESLKGMWNVTNKCGWFSNIRKCTRWLWGPPVGMYDVIIETIGLLIKKFKQKKRRSTDSLPEADAQSRFADEVGSAIAGALKWNTDVMDWLAYTGSVVDPHNLKIVMLLADKKALGIVSTPIPSINFNQTIQEFASAVRQGKLHLKVDGYNVWVKTLASCSDKACNNTQTLAVSDKPPNWNGAARISGGNIGLCGVIAVLIMMMDKLFY